MGDETKKCPACAESVKAEAVICRFCNYDFKAGLPPGGGSPAAPPPPPPPPKSSKTLVWVLLGCGCAGALLVIPIIAAIAIPGLLAAQGAANARNASATLKTLTAAEADFRINDRDGNRIEDYWTADVSGLYYLAVEGRPISLIEPALAMADANPDTDSRHPRVAMEPSQPKAGYRFIAMQEDETGRPYNAKDGRHLSKYGFCAYPVAKNAGRYTFIVNQDAVIWRKDTGGTQVLSWPVDPAAEGWSRLD